MSPKQMDGACQEATVAKAGQRRRRSDSPLSAALVLALTILATSADAQSAQSTKLAPEILYVDPYTGIAYNYVLTGQIAGPTEFDGPAAEELAAAVLRHPQTAAARATSVKRSAAVKRERIIMDALGGDYLIRKRTII